MTDEKKPSAAFVGFGEVNTPPELIASLCDEAAAQIKGAGVALSVISPVTDDPGGKQAARAAAELARLDFDALVVCVAGWIPSWAVLSAIERFRHKPMVLLGLTGRREGGRFLTTAAQAGTTALRKPMADMGYRFKYLPCIRDGGFPAGEIASWCAAATAAAGMRGSRIGMAGYRDMRLYGTLYEGVSLKGTLGVEIEHVELLEIGSLMAGIPGPEVTRLCRAMKKKWRFLGPAAEETLANSARFCLAAGRLARERGWSGFSWNDVDGVKKLMGFSPAGAMTLFHQEFPGIPTIPENDAHGAVTQLMVRRLTGQEAAYLEFYEFLPGGVLAGVPDFVPPETVEGPVTVMPRSFGSFGEGLLNVSKLKTGPVTLCRLGTENGRYLLHAVEGDAQTPEPWEEAGWEQPAPQLPGLEITFREPGGRDFAERVMGQHYIVSRGAHRSLLRDLCRVLDIDDA